MSFNWDDYETEQAPQQKQSTQTFDWDAFETEQQPITNNKTVSNPIQSNTSTADDKPITLQGGVQKKTFGSWYRNNIRPKHFLKDLGKSAYNGFREESILGANALTGAKNWALDKVGLSDWHRPTEEVKAEREALIPKAEVNPDAHVANFIGDIAGWSPMFAVGGEAVQGIKLPKFASKVGNILGGSHNAGLDMAAFEGLRHELRQLGGEQDESTLAQNLLNGYGTGAAIGGAFGTLGAVAKPVIKAGLQSAPAQYIGRKVAPALDWLGSTKFGSGVLNAIGAKAPEGTETRKMQELNAILSKDNNFTPEVEQMANQAEGLTKKQYYKLYHKLRHGEKTKSGEKVETPQEPANTPEAKLEEIKAKAKEKRLEKENVKTTDVTPEEYNSLVEQLREAGHDDAQIEEILSSHGIKLKAEVNPEQKVEFIKDETPDNIEITSDTEEALKGRVKPETIEGIEITSDTPEKLTGRVNTEKGSPVKSEEGINTPKDTETLQNDQSVGTQNEDTKFPDKIRYKGHDYYYNPKTDMYEVKQSRYDDTEFEYVDRDNYSVKRKGTPDSPIIEKNKQIIDKSPDDVDVSRIGKTTNKYIEPNTNIQNIPEGEITKLEPGKAEGSETSYRDLTRKKADTAQARREELNEALGEDNWYEKDIDKEVWDETSSKNARFVSQDQGFNDWYSRYENAGINKRRAMIKSKFESFKTNEERQAFYDSFDQQMMRDKEIAELKSRQGDITKPTITERDLSTVLKHYKATGKLASGKKIKKVEEVNKIETVAEDFGLDVLKAMGKGKNKPLAKSVADNAVGLSSFYRKEIIGEKATTAIKRARQKAKVEYEAALGNQRSKIALDKMYEQKLKTIENSDASNDAKAIVKDELEKAYNKNLKRFEKKENKFVEDSFDTNKQNNDYDISNTKFAKSNRSIGSQHKIKDYSEDFSRGDKEIQRVIDEYVGDVDFTYEDMYSAGRSYEDGTISINSKMSPIQQLLTGTHETHHKIAELIAKACGKGSREMNLWDECLQANYKLNSIVKKTPGVVELNKTFNSIKKNKEKLSKWLNNLSKSGKKYLQEYRDALVDKKTVDAEFEAELAKDGEWIFYGKDIKYYEQKLKAYKRTIIENKGDAIGGNDRGRGSNGDIWQIDGRNGNNSNNSTERKFIEDSNVNFDSEGASDKPEAVKDTINPKATEVKAPSDFDNIYEGVKEISKQGEKVATDLRWITPEQAANRLKQQSKEGNGVYFKQGTNDLTSGMDISLDYLEGRNSKEGLTGRKKIKGLVRKGSAKDIVVNTYKSTANRQHVADCLDFVEKNYAKPIPEDGKVPEGYVKVNRYALSFAQVNGLTREWLDAVMKGDKAIDANFGHLGEEGGYAKAVKDLRNYWTKDGEYSYMIPKSVRNYMLDEHGEVFTQYWDRYIKHNPAENGGIRGNKKRAFAKLAGEVNDFLLDRFKRGVLTSASFVLNNRMGNQMMIAAHSKNPAEYIQSIIEAGKLKDEKLPIELRENLISEAIGNSKMPRVRTGIKWFDTFADLCNGNFIDLKSTKSKSIELAPKSTDYVKLEGMTVPKGSKVKEHNTLKTYLSGAGNSLIALPNKAFNWFSDNLMKVNQACENFERKQAAYIQAKRLSKENAKAIPTMARQITAFPSLMDIAKDNPEFEQAIVKNVEDMLGNYRNFNKYEKGILKRLVPFYSWYRTMARHETQLFKRNPVRWGMIHYELAQLKKDNSNRKEYQQNAITTPLKDNGARLVIGKGAQIPYNTYPEVLDNWTGQGSPVSGLNPVLVNTAETIRGKKFFLDQDISDKKYTRPYKDANYFVNTETGEKVEHLPISVRANYFRKNVIDPTIYPSLKSPMVNTEWLGHGVKNLATKDKWETPDKFYDTSYSGYSNGDLYKDNTSRGRRARNGRKAIPKGYRERYAANDLSEQYKTANRLMGLTLQKERLENKTRKWREKFKKK